jgi:N-alpha-acetyltransferase 50
MDLFIARWRAAAMSTAPSKEPTVTCTPLSPLRTSPAPSKPTPTSTLLPFEATGPLLHLTEPPSLPPTPPRTRTATPQSQKPAAKQASTSPTTSTPSTLPSPTTPPQTWPTPHPHIHITTPQPSHFQPLKRLHGTLLPIRYSDKFFNETINSPEHNALSRVAIYKAPSKSSSGEEPREEVVGAIRARLEDEIPSPIAGTEPAADEDDNPSEKKKDDKDECDNPPKKKKKLYIQTLLLLSPYRSHGVATTLLSSLLTSLHSIQATTDPPISIVAVQAHVHETNEEALDWYRKRGFQVMDGLVEGYYRKLKPSGARIVRMDLTPNLTGCVSGDRKARNEKGERAKRKRETEEGSEKFAVGE